MLTAILAAPRRLGSKCVRPLPQGAGWVGFGRRLFLIFIIFIIVIFFKNILGFKTGVIPKGIHQIFENSLPKQAFETPTNDGFSKDIP